MVNEKKRVVEEDRAISERLIRKLYEVESDEHFERIMISIEPLLRNKTIAILIMGGNYQEVNDEKEKSHCTNDERSK